MSGFMTAREIDLYTLQVGEENQALIDETLGKIDGPRSKSRRFNPDAAPESGLIEEPDVLQQAALPGEPGFLKPDETGSIGPAPAIPA